MNEKGNITIYLSIVLSAVIVLNFALMDTLEVSCEKHNLQNKTDLSIESLLTEYDFYLHKDYGLYGLAVNNENYYTKELTVLLENNDNTGGFEQISDYLVDKIELIRQENLSDVSILEEEILTLAKYEIGEELGEKAVEYLRQLTGSAKSSEVYNRYKMAGEMLDKCRESYEKFYINVMGTYEGDMECINGYSQQMVDNFVKICKNGAEIGVVGENFTNAVNMLYKYLDKFIGYHTLAYSYGKELMENKENLKNMISELELLICKKENSEYKEAMEKLITDMKAFLKYFDNLQAVTDINANLTTLVNSKIKLENVLTEISNAQKEERKLDTEVIAENLSNFEVKLKTSFSIKKLEQEESSEKINIKDRVQELTEGLFETNIQDKEIESSLYKSLPSRNAKEKEVSFLDLLNSNILENLKNNVMTDCYIIEYFRNFQKFDITRYGYLQGEVEYIIAGKDSEKENRNGVITRLTTVRTVFNLEHILTNKDKMDLARKIGNSMATTYSEGIGGPVYTAGVIMIWASSESALDVKDLLKGKNVPLIKTEKTWKLDLVSGEDSGKSDENSDNKGLSYEEYLQILLFFVKNDTKLLRIQDLIELNITKFTGNRYYLKNIYTCISCKINYKLQLFVMKGGSYEFTVESKRKYI